MIKWAVCVLRISNSASMDISGSQFRTKVADWGSEMCKEKMM